MKILVSRSSGSALIVTIVTTAIIGLSLAAYLDMTSTQHRSVVRSEAWNSCIPLAEAGIEEALQACFANATNLSSQGWTSNSTFSIGGFSLFNSRTYNMSRTLGPGRYEVAISNLPPTIYGTGYRTTPLGANEVHRSVRVITIDAFLFARGLVARSSIDMGNGNVDSFDSGGVTNYSLANRRAGGDVASITGNVAIGSNGEILGKVAVSAGHTITSSGYIGPVYTYTGGVNPTNGTAAGYTSYAATGTIPTVEVPPGVGPGVGTAVSMIGNGEVVFSGSSASGVYYTAGAPASKYGQINGSITVTGGAHVTLYVAGDIAIGGTGFINISSNSSLTIYMAGANAVFAGNGVANTTGNALNFTFYGLPSNTLTKFAGNGAVVGTVIAPNADFVVDGSGESGGFVGAAIVNTASFSGTGANFHYDENLGRNGPKNGYQVVSWEEL